MSAVVAVASLFLMVVPLLAFPPRAILPAFVFGLFLLALVGVLGGLEGRTVWQREPAMHPGRGRYGW